MAMKTTICDTRVLLINPPMLVFEPDYPLTGTLGRLRLESMHPGLLSIVSYLRRNGIDAEILNLFDRFTTSDLEEKLKAFNPAVIGISSTSAWDYLESLDIARRCKEWNETVPVLMGGQQVGSIASKVFEDSENIDLVAEREGEWVVLETVRCVADGRSLTGIAGTVVRHEGRICRSDKDAPVVPFEELGPMDHALYPDYQRFMPIIEDSRGCPRACSFCINSHTFRSRQRLKPLDLIQYELKNIRTLYRQPALVGVSSSDFGSHAQHALEVADAFAAQRLGWMAGMHLDNEFERFVEPCMDAGLRILVTGLESSVHHILRRMRKTRDPGRYLERFHRLADALAARSRSELRVNMLVYIGATPEDLDADHQFVSSLSGKIAGIACVSTMVHDGATLMRQFPRFEEETGCRLWRTDYATRTHFYPCDLSSRLSFTQSLEWCNQIEKKFSIDAVYYHSRLPGADGEDLKGF